MKRRRSTAWVIRLPSRTAGGTLPAAVMLGVSLVLSGCGTRPGADVLQSVSTVPAEVKKVTVYVATTRERTDPASNVFTQGRDSKINYARFTITTPPDHKPGNIEWPKRGQRPDPAKTFTVASQATLQYEDFTAAVKASAADYKGDHAPIGVFVHGYNTSFQEALFRFAQLSADADIDGVPVLFAWPSQAALAGYVADKEAVTYSRDYLADLLIDLARAKPKGKILLFGHSMGGWLVAETLRQLKLTGREDVLARLSVVLAAPDIDADVFRQQIAVIGPMSPPMTILVSRDDRALKASSILAGNQRIGALDISDPEIQAAASKEKVRLVDISELQAGDRINHDRYIALATRYPQFTAQQKEVDLNTVGAFVFDAAAATVSSPFRLVSAALSSAQ